MSPLETVFRVQIVHYEVVDSLADLHNLPSPWNVTTNRSQMTGYGLSLRLSGFLGTDTRGTTGLFLPTRSFKFFLCILGF